MYASAACGAAPGEPGVTGASPCSCLSLFTRSASCGAGDGAVWALNPYVVSLNLPAKAFPALSAMAITKASNAIAGCQLRTRDFCNMCSTPVLVAQYSLDGFPADLLGCPARMCLRCL